MIFGGTTIDDFRMYRSSIPLSMMNSNSNKEYLSYTSVMDASLGLSDHSIALTMCSYRICRRVYALQESHTISKDILLDRCSSRKFLGGGIK